MQSALILSGYFFINHLTVLGWFVLRNRNPRRDGKNSDFMVPKTAFLHLKKHQKLCFNSIVLNC